MPVAGSAAAAAAALGAAAGPPRCPAWAEPLELAPLVLEVHAVGGGGAAGRRKAHGARRAGGGRPLSPPPARGDSGGGAGGLDLAWWDWGTTDAQQKKGWSMSAAQQMLSRIEHVYAHAEAMSARTMP